MIIEVHWVFSILVSSPSSLAKAAKLWRRLNEYQIAPADCLKRRQFAPFRCRSIMAQPATALASR